MWVYVYSVCVHAFVLRPFLFPYGGDRTQDLRSACKTDQVDFTDWMPFLPSHFMEEISPNTEAPSKNP